MRGLVPRWGGGGAWQNPPCQFAVPSHNSGFSYSGVPAPAGMSDWYENDVTWPRDCPNATTLQSTSMPALHRRILPSRRPMVDGGMRKCSAGACPPLGRRRGAAEPAVPIRRTKAQLQLFTPWRAGDNRDERLVRKHVPDSDPGCAQMAFECASEPPNSSFPRRRESTH